jgi:general secretion pathway protein G
MSKRSGFTLIELVVVIMILGILAAVAAPKFLGTSSTAIDNGAKQTLAIVRDAIELYAAKNGAVPTCDGAPNTLFKAALSPFMRGNFPTCAVGNVKNADIAFVNTPGVALTVDATPACSWKYNNATGEFIINSSIVSSLGTAYSSF